MKKILAMLILTAMVFAGCGKSAADSTFTVGMECNYAPFNWTQTEKSDTTVALEDGVSFADGYDVVMAKKIADGLGKTLVIKKIAWEGLQPALSSGEIDAIIAGMTATPERKENADFTTPYYESDMVVIVRGDDSLANITSIQELSGKNVLGQINTIYDEVIPQINGVNHMTPLATYPLMVASLKSGDADALTAELPVALGVVGANPDLKVVQFEKGSGFEADTTVSIAVKKDNKALLDAVQKVLDGVTADERLNWMVAATERQPATE